MFSTKRTNALVSSMLFSLAAIVTPAANAAAATVDPSACAKPDFPSRWANEGDSGNVVVAFLVGADGKVSQAKLVESSGYLRVDRASVRALERCTFEAKPDGAASSAWTRVKYTWVAE